MGSLLKRASVDDVFPRPWLMFLLLPIAMLLYGVGSFVSFLWERKKGVAFLLLSLTMVVLSVSFALASDYNVTANDSWSGASITDFTLLMSPSYLFTQDLVAYYRLSNLDTTASGGVVDLRSGLNGTASGYTVNHGVVSGGVTINETTGAMVFDGVDGLVNTNKLVDFSDGKSRVFQWKFRFDTFDPQILSSNAQREHFSSGHFEGFNLEWSRFTNGQLRLTWGNGTSNFRSDVVGNLDLDTDYVLTLYVEGDTYTSFINETQTNTRTSAIISSSADSGLTLKLGRSGGGGGSSANWFLNGNINYFRYWEDISLATFNKEQEFTSPYAVRGDGLVWQGSGRDFVGTAASPTTILDKNMVVSTGVVNVPTAWYFDGAEYISLPTNGVTHTAESTIGFWFTPDNLSQTSTIFNDVVDSNNRINIVQSSTTNNVLVRWRLGGVTYTDRSTSTDSLSEGENYFVVARFDNGVTSLSLNTINSTGNIAPPTSNTGGINIGRRSDNTQFFTGSVSGFFYSDRWLSDDEVLALYNDGAGTAYPFSKPSENVSTTSGVVSLFVPDGYGIEQDLTILANDYFSRTYSAYSFETSGNLHAELVQSTADFTATDVLGNLVSDFNVTIDGTTLPSSATWNLSAGSYNATFSKSGWFNLTQEFTTSPLTNHAFMIEGVYNHVLQLSVNDLSGAGDPNVFAVNITNPSVPSWSQFLSVDANLSEVTSSLQSDTSLTTSPSFVVVATLFPDSSVVNPVLTDVHARFNTQTSVCDFRAAVYYVDGSVEFTDILSRGNTDNSITGSITLTGYDVSKVVERVDYEIRRTDGTFFGCRLLVSGDGTYITVKQAPSVFANLVHGNYSVGLRGFGWVENNYSVDLNSSQKFTSYVMDVFVASTVLFEFRDIDTQQLIDDRNINVSLEGSTASYNFNTSDGTLIAAPVNSDTYKVVASASGYSSNELFVTTTADNQTVVMYLDSTTSEILFLVRDTLGEDVSEATLTFLRNVNGSQVVFTQSKSDFSGAASVLLNTGVQYSFTVEHPGYSVFADVINPSTALSPYVVRLRPLEEEVFVSPLQRVKYFVRGPTIPLDRSWAYFEFETQSSDGLLQWFSAESTYLGEMYGLNVSGSPGGGIIPLNITNLNVSQENIITIDFAFKAVGFETVSWSQDFQVSPYTAGQYTIKAVLEGARSSLGAVGGAILGTILVLLSVAAVSVGARNVSVGAIAGLFALGVMTWVGLFSLTYGLLAAVFIGMLIVADNIVGGVV